MSQKNSNQSDFTSQNINMNDVSGDLSFFTGGLKDLELSFNGTFTSGSLVVESTKFDTLDAVWDTISTITASGDLDITTTTEQNNIRIRKVSFVGEVVVSSIVKKKSSLSTIQEEIPDGVDKGLVYTTTPTPIVNENDIYTAAESGTIFGIGDVREGDYLYSDAARWWCLRKELFESSFLADPSPWYVGDYDLITSVIQKLTLKCIRDIDFTWYSKPNWVNEKFLRIRRINGINSIQESTGNGFISIVLGDSAGDVSDTKTMNIATSDINSKVEYEYTNSKFFLQVNANTDYFPYSVDGSSYSNISTTAGTSLQMYVNKRMPAANFNALDYVLDQEAIAEYYSIPVVDLYRGSGINIENYADYVEADNLHPNNTAYNFISKKIAKVIDNNSDAWATSGQTIGWFGGSFCENAGVTRTFVDTNLGTTSTNYGLGGAGFADTASTQIYDQVTSAVSHDIFVIWCSTNDLANPNATIGGLKTTDTSSQAYGLEKTIKDLYLKNDNAKIILINTIKTYSNAYGYDTTEIRESN